MPVVGRLDQYGSMLVTSEFNEVTGGNVRFSGLGTYYASEFNENIVDIVRNGLVMNLDAGNVSSYPGSGTTWTDVSGNGNNGTLTLGPTYSSVNGGSIVFDGTNDYVSVPRPSSIVTGGQITISLWAKWLSTGTDTSTIQALIDNDHRNSPLQGFVIQDRPDLAKSLTFSPKPDIDGAVSTFVVGNGSWHHITGTYDGSTVKLYIDGNLNAQVSQSGGLATVQPNITLGQWQGAGSPARHLNGNIAQASIYSRALSASEVLQNYNALASRFGLSTTNLTAPMSASANVFAPYQLVDDEFAGVLYGSGQGTFMRQNTDNTVIVYNEIDEITTII